MKTHLKKIPIFVFIAASFIFNVATAQGKKFTFNSDGNRVEVRNPTCKGAEYTKFMAWGGDFYESWCLDRDRMTREMKINGGIRIGGVYEKVADKIIFWRNIENKQCVNGHQNFIELFNSLHKFYEMKPELLYRDLDEGIGEFIRTAPSCR